MLVLSRRLREKLVFPGVVDGDRTRRRERVQRDVRHQQRVVRDVPQFLLLVLRHGRVQLDVEIGERVEDVLDVDRVAGEVPGRRVNFDGSGRFVAPGSECGGRAVSVRDRMRHPTAKQGGQCSQAAHLRQPPEVRVQTFVLVERAHGHAPLHCARAHDLARQHARLRADDRARFDPRMIAKPNLPADHCVVFDHSAA